MEQLYEIFYLLFLCEKWTLRGVTDDTFARYAKRSWARFPVEAEIS